MKKSLHAALGALLLLPLLALADVGDGDHGPRDFAAAPGAPEGGFGPGFGPALGPGFGPGGHHGFDGVPPMPHVLKLDEAQRDKIFAIHHAAAPALRNAGKTLRQNQEELRKLAASTKFDEARAKQLADAAGRAGAELALLQARSLAQTLAVLTDAQRKQLEEAKQPPMHGGPAGPQRRPEVR